MFRSLKQTDFEQDDDDDEVELTRNQRHSRKKKNGAQHIPLSRVVSTSSNGSKNGSKNNNRNNQKNSRATGKAHLVNNNNFKEDEQNILTNGNNNTYDDDDDDDNNNDDENENEEDDDTDDDDYDYYGYSNGQEQRRHSTSPFSCCGSTTSNNLPTRESIWKRCWTSIPELYKSIAILAITLFIGILSGYAIAKLCDTNSYNSSDLSTVNTDKLSVTSILSPSSLSSLSQPSSLLASTLTTTSYSSATTLASVPTSVSESTALPSAPTLTLEEATENLMNEVDAHSIRENLIQYTSRNHMAGTTGYADNAQWTVDKLRSFNVFHKVTVHPYKALLNYPCSNKKTTLQVVQRDETSNNNNNPNNDNNNNNNNNNNNDNNINTSTTTSTFSNYLSLNLTEKSYLDQPDNVPSFVAYSPNKTAQGLPLYVNYGRYEDFEKLVSSEFNITVKDTLCIARYGKVFRGDKVKMAQQYGCAGLLIFSDPADYARDAQKLYPQGPWLPTDGTQRGSIYLNYGDPASPAWPSIPSTNFASFVPTDVLPQIPVQPISYGNARILLGALGGPLAPSTFKGGLNIKEYRLGPGFSSTPDFNSVEDEFTPIDPAPTPISSNLLLNLDVCSSFEYKDIFNIVAEIRGSVEPDRIVVVGNHGDAWGARAIDPSSGSASMLELARAVSTVVKKGWRPRRSIFFCSWDAEEFGLIGSTEWTDHFKAYLSSRVVAYLNVDIAVEGIDKLKVSATPNLQDAIFRAARRLKQPGTDFTVYDIWYLQSKQKYGSSLTQPYIGALGSGSDYTSFLCHYGVPSADMRFTTLEDFSSYPTYHSQSDTFDYVDRILDPGFIFHATLTKIWGGVLIELADSPVVSLNYIPYAYAVYTQLQAVFDLDSWKSLGIESTATAEATSLALAFFNKAKIFHSFGLAVAPTLENALLIRQLNDRLMSVEKLFLLDQGLPGRWYFKHMVYAPASHNTYEGTVFPGLRDSIFERNSQQAKVQLAHIIVALNQVVDLLTT